MPAADADDAATRHAAALNKELEHARSAILAERESWMTKWNESQAECRRLKERVSIHARKPFSFSAFDMAMAILPFRAIKCMIPICLSCLRCYWPMLGSSTFLRTSPTMCDIFFAQASRTKGNGCTVV